MKTRSVPSSEISAEKGFRAEDYLYPNQTLEDVSDLVWGGINEVAALCFQDSKKHGWWDKYLTPGLKGINHEAAKFLPEIVGMKFMLKVTELAEAYEEVRDGRDLFEIYYSGSYKNNDEDSEVIFKGTLAEVRDWLDDQVGVKTKGPKPEGVPIELADAIIRIFDFCAFFKIDIAEAIRLKMTFNETRPYKHGGKVS